MIMARMPGLKSKIDVNRNMIPFSWDEYLKDSNEKPAPKCCFKQAVDPPTNEFTPGMKLESKDPRNDMSYCIATVVGLCGSRLCLRLDGSDNRNDFWCLVDSDYIHPYGWCESSGEQLVPPLGFEKNAASYPSFLSKLLQECKDRFAPKTCFREPPPSPSHNMFEIGMKLEAVDRKNPHQIMPATIGDVDGDKVLIQFDGWRGAFDFWCKYDSRDIFPVGWCSSTGHPLQPPGSKGNLTRVGKLSLSKSTSVSPNISVTIESSQSAGIPSPGSVRSADSIKNSPSLAKIIPPSPSLSPTDLNSGVSVTAYVNQTCICGPNLNPTSVIRLPLHYGPYPINRTLRKIVQALVDSANNPAMIFNNLVVGTSSITICAKICGKVQTCSLPILHTEASFQTYLANVLERIECCPNLITIQPLKAVCDKCHIQQSEPEPFKRTSSVITDNGHLNVKRPKQINTTLTTRSRTRKSLGSSTDVPMFSLSSSTLPVPSSSNPLDWNSNDVIQFIRAKDPTLAKQAHLFQEHEIDGRALLLVTSDIAIKYMNMKVGPALKLCSLIDQLKIGLRYEKLL